MVYGNIFITPEPSVSQSKEEMQEELKSDNPYFKPCFDFFYYFGLSPFCFVFTPHSSSNCWLIRESKLQKIWHFIIVTLVTLTGLTTLRFAWLAQSPIVIFYFQLTCQIFNFSLKPASFCLFWKRKEAFQKCINMVRKSPLLSQRGTKVRLVGIFLCVLMIFRALLTSISGQSAMIIQDWSPSLLLGHYVTKARFAFNLQTNISSLQFPTDMPDVSNMDILMTSTLIVSEFFQTTHYYLLTIYLQMSALTLFEASKSFTRSLKEVTPKYSNQALQNFMEMKALSIALNDALGPVTILLMLFYGLYFSTDLDNIFVPTNWILKCVFILDFFDPVIFVVVSAEACQANDRFRLWISDPDNYEYIPRNEIKLKLLLDELWTKPVGLRGSGKFVIDYTFVGHVSVVILTLFVVVLQSKYK